jgi:hypothetical protein
MTSPHDSQMEQAVVRCDSAWADNYFNRYYGQAAPYLPVHAEIIRDMLLAKDVTPVLGAEGGRAA